MYLLHYFAIFYTSIVALLFSQIAILAILGWLKKLLRQRAILSQYDKLYSDYQKAYDGLVDYADKAHCRAKHSKNEFANNRINGIENFKDYTKQRLSKFKSIKKENFLLHLKEYKFRCNTKTTQKIYIKLLKLTRENQFKVC